MSDIKFHVNFEDLSLFYRIKQIEFSLAYLQNKTNFPSVDFAFIGIKTDPIYDLFFADLIKSTFLSVIQNDEYLF